MMRERPRSRKMDENQRVIGLQSERAFVRILVHEHLSHTPFDFSLHSFVNIQEARIPLMLVDSLIVYSLSVWEKQIKSEGAKIVEEQAVAHETDKQAARAVKTANREQRKAEQKNVKNQGQPYVTPKHNIQQPDKSKKM